MPELHRVFTGATTPYTDPATQLLESGKTVAQSMPSAPARGLKGTIVPPAGPGGVPYGANPHNVAGMTVNLVSNDASGEHVTALQLGGITPELMAAAAAAAHVEMPMPRTAQEQQAKAALTMQILAQMQQAGQQATVKVAKAQPRGAVQPLAAFAQAPPTPPLPAMAAGPVATMPPQPTVQVTYEGRGFGTLPAVYHAVIREPGFVVLVHDLRWVSAPYFPPAAGVSVGQLGFYVQDDNEAHIVEATGIEYTYDGKRFCVLSIVDSREV